MIHPGSEVASGSFFRRYRAPLVAAVLLLSGLLLWVGWVERGFQDWELAKGRDYVQGFQHALVVYLEQLGPRQAPELSAAFDLLVDSSHPLGFVVLLREGKRVAGSRQAPERFPLDGPEGIESYQGGYAIWCPFQGRLREAGGLVPPGTLTLVLFVDHRPPERHWLGPMGSLLLGSGVASLGILMAMFAWGLTIRNRDLSERLLREQSERRHLDRLGVAAAGLAHETKNPLGIILGHAQRLVRTPGLAEDARETIFQIQDAAESACTRLGEFIEYARLREIDPTAVQGTQLVERATAALGSDFEEGEIELRLEVDPLVLHCDREMTTQVLVNLLLNSLHASRPGQRVTVALTRQGDSACLSVTDQGCGIPAELLPRVFDPYVSGATGGHGLGLAIVKMVADRHGWSVDLTSTEGEGTTVTIVGITLRGSEEVSS